MSISLSPEIIARAKEVKLFVTVCFSHFPSLAEVRLPSQPIAPMVMWDPIGLDGYAKYIAVHDETGTDLERWEAVIKAQWPIRSVWDFGPQPLMRHFDLVRVHVNKLTARPEDSPAQSG